MMTAGGVAAAISAIGIAQVIAGWRMVHRFSAADEGARTTGRGRADGEPVSVLKPLHGNEPLLEEALASVCRQDYAAWQVVFGVHDAADAALPVVRRLSRRFPDLDLSIVVDPTVHGANGKIGNLINMLPAAKHGVLVISDADMHVAPDWLRRVVAALQAPGVGVVTTVYTGVPAPPPRPSPAARERGRWSRFGAMQINQYFLPGVLLARAMGRQDCLGATMALRRETLERIGGLRALADHLADDNVLGQLVRRLGMTVGLAGTIPATTVAETTLRSLWRHELRWARTIRALAPGPFAASALQYPLAWAVLAALLAGGAAWSLGWLALAWGLRGLVARGTDRTLGLANRTPFWLLLPRELMSVAVLVASYGGRRVDWRGHTMQAEGFHQR